MGYLIAVVHRADSMSGMDEDACLIYYPCPRSGQIFQRGNDIIWNIKKLILLNLPYILVGLFATNFGEAWRLAQGGNASEKMLGLFAVLPDALGSFWPSLHPLDLLVGICCGAALRLAVYLKGKNAKKYRHNVEYGSARWSA